MSAILSLSKDEQRRSTAFFDRLRMAVKKKAQNGGAKEVQNVG
jgi:hypothetical protein